MIYITGSGGQLGSEFKKTFSTHEATFLDHNQLDLSKLDSVEEFLRTTKITTLINTAAYTNVEKAESESTLVQTINTEAPKLMAKYAESRKFKFVHYSTDYVFSGRLNRPYRETDAGEPLNEYGKSKYLSEKSVAILNPNSLIIRTSWVYSTHGKNFLNKIISLIEQKQELKIVNDQQGTPTSSVDLARATLDLLKADACGLYNFSNEGIASWYDFAKEICRLKNPHIQITPISSSDFPSAALRPHYSVLSKDKIKPIINYEIPNWRDSLAKTMKS